MLVGAAVALALMSGTAAAAQEPSGSPDPVPPGPS